MQGAPPSPAGSPPWIDALASAMHRTRREPAARFAQLATRDRGGAPRCRTIVIRGLNAAEGAILFCADARSPKIDQLEGDFRAEICWYFADLREQFRLGGRVVLARAVSAGDIADLPVITDLPGIPEIAEPAPTWLSREAMWDELSTTSKQSFFGPAPGSPLSSQASPFPGSSLPEPPDSFVAAALIARAVDHLRLVTTPHQRTLFERTSEGMWTAAEICP